jgi:DNA helicase MCM8
MRGNQEMNRINTTVRAIESLKRLCEARAKAELRETATYHDAIEVIKLYQETVIDVATYNVNGLSRRIPLGASNQVHKSIGDLSMAKQRLFFLDKLRDLEITQSESQLYSLKDLKELGDQLGMRVGDFGLFVDKLNYEGFLLKKG